MAAVNGQHGVGQVAEVHSVYQEMVCDVVDLQETRRGGQSALLQAGYVVYCMQRGRTKVEFKGMLA